MDSAQPAACTSTNAVSAAFRMALDNSSCQIRWMGTVQDHTVSMHAVVLDVVLPRSCLPVAKPRTAKPRVTQHEEAHRELELTEAVHENTERTKGGLE